VGAARTESIGGNRTSRILGEVTEEVTGKAVQQSGGDRLDEAGRHTLTEVKDATAFVAKTMKLQADELAVVVAGELALLINKSGTVKLWAKSLTVDGSNIKFKGKKIHKKSGGSGQQKPFQEVLDASVATKGKTYGPDEPGPLEPDEIKSFKDGKYRLRRLKKSVKVERLHGGTASPEGRWISRGPRPTGLEGKIRMALRPEWGNTADQSSAFIIKAGTKVYEGVAAGQGTGYVGGATQLLIKVPKVETQKGPAAVIEFLVKNVLIRKV
jgi:type VI secretion system secreted protein VgrG